MNKVGDLITYKVLGKQEYAIILGFDGEFTNIQVLKPGEVTFHSAGFDTKHVTNISELIGMYEQQKQQINKLKTEIIIINNDAVNSGDEAQMEITGRVIEVLENTIIDDWRDED